MSGPVVVARPDDRHGRTEHIVAHDVVLRLTPIELQLLGVRITARLAEIDQRPQPPSTVTDGHMSPYHRRYLHALLREYGAEGDDRFPVLSTIIRREVTSTNDLTPAEASACISSLRYELAHRTGAF